MQPAPQEIRLPDETWGEIGRFLSQKEFIRAQVALAGTNKQLYALFGGYRFALDQAALDQALAQPGEAKAIVLAAPSLTIDRDPDCHTAGGTPTPVISYGSNAGITGGHLLVRNATVTGVSGGLVVAKGHATVTGVSGGLVVAEDQTRVTDVSGGEVWASGEATVTGVIGGAVFTAGQATVTDVTGGAVVAGGQSRVTEVVGGRLIVGENAKVSLDLAEDEIIRDTATPGRVLWPNGELFITGDGDGPVPDTVEITLSGTAYQSFPESDDEEHP